MIAWQLCSRSENCCLLFYEGSKTIERLVIPPPSVKLGEKRVRSLKSKQKWLLWALYILSNINSDLGPKLYTTNWWICPSARFLEENWTEVSSWNTKKFICLLIFCLSLEDYNEVEIRKNLTYPTKKSKRIGKRYLYMPKCRKTKSSAEVQQILLLYFKFYFRTILKKTCKHSLLYICNVYTVSVGINLLFRCIKQRVTKLKMTCQPNILGTSIIMKITELTA